MQSAHGLSSLQNAFQREAVGIRQGGMAGVVVRPLSVVPSIVTCSCAPSHSQNVAGSPIQAISVTSHRHTFYHHGRELLFMQLFFFVGNAALVLRSRLKVKVVKEHREKKAMIQNGIEENGLTSPSLEKEMFKQVMQYQVGWDTHVAFCFASPLDNYSQDCPKGILVRRVWLAGEREQAFSCFYRLVSFLKWQVL